jgi:predicted transcriptional regulator
MTKDVAADNAESIEPIIVHTAEIVGAFVKRNLIAAAEVPNLMRAVHSTLRSLRGGATGMLRNDPKPAVPVRRSISPEYITCLEDGKKLKMLKRYLRSRYGLSPDEYRLKWNLAADYPMVAPNYSSQRSMFAKRIGLGCSKVPPQMKRKSV